MWQQSFVNLWRNRSLAREMARRELLISNKGALLGFAWLVIRPFVQVASLVVVVSFVFGVRFGTAGHGRFDYAVYVLAGMIPWQILSKTLEEAPSLVRDRVEILKQVVYPLEILPVTSLLGAVIGPGIALVVYLLLSAVGGELHWSLVLLPLPVSFLFFFLIGSAWILMMVGVILKDLREIIGIIFSVLVYLSPVVMSQNMVGARVWSLVKFNPFFHVITAFRDVFEGSFHPMSWVVFVAMAAVAFSIGIFVLGRARAMLNELI